MKREVKREKKLPAFSITVADFEVLWGRLLALFENTDKVYSSIEINLPTEKLEFNDIEELKTYASGNGKIRNFSFYLSSNGRRVSVRSYGFLSKSNMEVMAYGDSESWCAGAIETVYSFLHSYKLWYNWFVSAPYGWIFLLLLNTPSIMFFFAPKDAIPATATVIGWLIALFAIGFLYLFKGKLFPASILVITENETFIKRHSAEIGLALAFLSVALTVIGLVVNHK